ncbi:MAG: AmmeMemoRadiSam system protein B [Verrucomicrobiota bacterium]|jgi:AmmeMemoRadiSam system protein A
MRTKRCGGAVARVLLAALLLPWIFCGCGSKSGAPRSNGAPSPITQGKPAQSQLRVRAPAVAGLFYPADARVLSNTVAALLATAPHHYIPHLKGLVCPHAGYEFSGLTAACGYQTLAGRDVQTVIVMGPSHYAGFLGVSVPDAEAYQTPLGLVPISDQAKQLVGTAPFLLEPRCPVQRPQWWAQGPKPAPAEGQDTPETWEHSVEVQVPFLQMTLTKFRILPLVFGEVDPEQVARVLAKQLDDQTIVVASSDLSHYYPYAAATNLDHHCIQAILNLDIESMKTQEACGKLPILTLMYLAREKGWLTQLLDCRNSGDVTGEKDRVVGYSAIAFYELPPTAYGASERKILLDLARTTLRRVATNGPLPEIRAAELPPKLAETKACFVTLTEQGQLRGCIGHLVPQEPLYRAIEDNAQGAAMRDPRFTPVQPQEVDRIKIEISVLTEPQPLAFNSPTELLDKLQPHSDGVVLRIGARRATYLPQVWDQIPDKVEFLNQLSEKAGCDSSAWRGKDASVSTYHVETFEEAE